MAKCTTSSWRSSQKGTWRPGSLRTGCGRRGSRSGRTSGSITGESPKGKVACSEVYSAVFSSPRCTIVQVPSRSVGDDRKLAGVPPEASAPRALVHHNPTFHTVKVAHHDLPVSGAADTLAQVRPECGIVL